MKNDLQTKMKLINQEFRMKFLLLFYILITSFTNYAQNIPKKGASNIFNLEQKLNLNAAVTCASSNVTTCTIDWDSPTTQSATVMTYVLNCSGRTITVTLTRTSGTIALGKINGADGSFSLQGAWLGQGSNSAVSTAENYTVTFSENGLPAKVLNADLGFWAINDNCDGNEDMVNFSTNGPSTTLAWTGEAGGDKPGGNCGPTDGNNAPTFVGGVVSGILDSGNSAASIFNAGPGSCCNDGGYMNFQDAAGFSQINFRRQIASLRTNTNLNANGFTSGYTNGVVLGGDNYDKSTSQFCVLCTPPTAPTLTSSALLSSCPSSSYNLTLRQPAPVSGTTYEWHTVATNPTAGDLINNPTAYIGAGPVYLYSIVGGCISAASAPLTLTPTVCGTNGACSPANLELVIGSAPTTNGPTNSVVASFLDNTNNPTGNTVVPYNPTVTTTYTVGNKQFPGTTNTTNPLSFGLVSAAAAPAFGIMNSYSSAAGSNFTTGVGAGLDINFNSGAVLGVNTRPIFDAGAKGIIAPGTSVYMGDMTLTFNNPIDNPIIHLADVGGGYFYSAGTQSHWNGTACQNLNLAAFTKTFTAEFELDPSVSPYTQTVLGGDPDIQIVGNKITNAQSNLNFHDASIRITGNGITTLKYKVFMKSVNGGYWAEPCINTATANPTDVIVVSVYIPATSPKSVTATATTISNTCPSSTVNLTSLQPIPVAGTSLEWHTASAPSTGTKINNPGTFVGTNGQKVYLFAKDIASGCLSATGSEVTITIVDCNKKISGTVFNDVNAGTVNGTGTNGGGLNANLIGPDGNVFATIPVNANGTYEFASVPPGTGYKVQISTNAGVPTQASPAQVLPSSFINTGDTNNGTGPNSPDGLSEPFDVVAIDVTGIDFGIQEPPVPGTDVANSSLNPGGINDATVPPATFSATDPNGGTVASIIITAIPTNATSITINGTKYDSGNPIPPAGITVPAPAGVPSQIILVDPIDGAVTVDIPYKAVDNVGAISPTTGSAKVPFTTTSLSGTVFNDVSGGDVDGIGTNGGGLNANLIGSDGKVVATLVIPPSGIYSFTDLNGGIYTVNISPTAGVPGQTPPSAAAPSGYVITGEFNGSPNTGNDGDKNATSQPVTLTASPTTDVNFGIEQPPVPTDKTLAEQTNPGGTISVPINPEFAATDPSPGIVSSIKITGFPPNVTTMTINSTPYTSGTFPPGGVIVLTNLTGVPTQSITIDPVDGTVTAVIPFKAIDNAGVESTTTANITVPFKALKVTGNVFNDVTGATDGQVNGPGIGTAGTALTVDLMSGTTVIATQPVASDGTYTFDNVAPGSYTVKLSPLSPASNFVNTGENNGAGPGIDPTVDGISEPFTVTNTDITDINFGIEQLPTAGIVTLTSEINPGGTITKNITSNFSGTDPDGGIISSLKITSMPTNATSIKIGLTTYGPGDTPFPVGGIIVPTNSSGVPSQPILVDPIDGTVTVKVPYVTIDNAGKESPTLGEVNVPFVSLSVSGNVYNDADGDTDGQVDGTPTNVGGAISAILKSGSTVIATVPVGADGKYKFDNVGPGSYTVEITSPLPTNYVNTGENNGAGPGIDGTINGKSEPFTVSNANITEVNFGIEQLPTAGIVTLTPDVNPGGTLTKNVTTNFSGTDPDGVVSKIRITGLPTNATSIKIGTITYGPGNTPFPPAGVEISTNSSGVPSLPILIDPIDGNVTVSIPYITIDNAGKESPIAGKVDAPFTTVSVAGNVFNDINGLNPTPVNTVDGTPTNAGGLNAILKSGTTTIATIPVAADGTYKFENVTPGTYTVELSALPTNWVHTGDNNGAGVGSSATIDGKSEPFSVVATNITNINFGIEQLPTANIATTTPEVNPGGTTTKAITPNFGGTDPDGGIISSIKITSMPTNTTTIKVGGTTYGPGNTPFPPAGIVVTTGAAGVPTVPILIDPIDGEVTVVIPYITTDNAGKDSPIPGSVTVPFQSLSVEGNVFNDLNGLNPSPTNTVDGTPTNAGGLFANLLNSAGTNVIASVPVGADGKYKFENVLPGSYVVEINKTAGVPASTPPAAGLPNGWVNTGENNDAPTISGSDGTVDSKSAIFSVSASDVVNINFGIEKIPTAGTATATSKVNPGGTTDTTVPPGTFSGSDPDGGTVDKIKITNFPTNVTSITIEGITYCNTPSSPDCSGVPFPVGGVTIPAPAGVPTPPIDIDPIDGAVTVVIPYKTIDTAGKESKDPGTASVPFTTVIVSGNVFNDPDKGNVNSSSSDPIPTGIFATLYNDQGFVIASVPVNPTTGAYEITDVNGGVFEIIIGTTQQTPGQPVSPANVPMGWKSTGESNEVAPGTPDSSIDTQSEPFTIVDVDVENINFGIKLLVPPTATNNVKLSNPAGPVTQQIVTEDDGLGVDSDPDGTLDLTSIDLDPSTPGQQTTLIVPGEGIWTVDDNLGNVKFTPEVGFTKDPTDITYTIKDDDGLVSNVATIHVDYVPVAKDDEKLNQPPGVVSVPILDNDKDGDTPVPTSVKITGTTNPGDPLNVPTEGDWTIIPTGITFTPNPGFTGDPTPITYTITDNDGNPSTAKVTVTYACVLEISGTVFLDTDGPVGVNSANGLGIDGTTIGTGLHMTLMEGALQKGVQPISATGTYLFTNIAAGTYTLVLSTTATGSATPAIPNTHVFVSEGGSLVSGVAQGDATADGKTTITVDCNAIIRGVNLRPNAVASYTNNDFGIKLNPAALPVDLITFDAKQIEDQVNLTWKVANEKKFSHFEIQRSENAKEFGALGIVNGKKSSIYSFVDSTPIEGINYYRLKMVDLDGSSKLSKVIPLNFEKGKLFVTVENPANNGEFKVMTNLKNPRFALLTSLGAKVEMNITEIGVNNFLIKAKNIPAGMYYLNIESNGKFQTRKVVVP